MYFIYYSIFSCKKHFFILQEKRRKNERYIHSIEKDIKTIIDKIQEIKVTAERDLQSEHQQRESQIEQKRNELNEVQAKFSTSNHQRQQLDNVIKSNKEKNYKMTYVYFYLFLSKESSLNYFQKQSF